MPRVNQIALDLRELEFDLVQPRTVGRREVEMHLRVGGEPRLHRFGFVG